VGLLEGMGSGRHSGQDEDQRAGAGAEGEGEGAAAAAAVGDDGGGDGDGFALVWAGAVLRGFSATRELQRRSANGRRRWPDVGM
jgi:hypothetical protein